MLFAIKIYSFSFSRNFFLFEKKYPFFVHTFFRFFGRLRKIIWDRLTLDFYHYNDHPPIGQDLWDPPSEAESLCLPTKEEKVSGPNGWVFLIPFQQKPTQKM